MEELAREDSVRQERTERERVKVSKPLQRFLGKTAAPFVGNKQEKAPQRAHTGGKINSSSGPKGAHPVGRVGIS